ncbi:MAG TPA: lipoprotein [Arenimonas sp.]|nr:lipoprotein [Arenimonas sp.]
MKTTARFALVLVYLTLLAACGTKGDLVLPERKSGKADDGARADQPAAAGEAKTPR